MAMYMATAKTGTFYLTETVSIPAGTATSNYVQGSVDLSAYINVPTGQALAIESVDFIFQAGTDYGAAVSGMMAGNGSLDVQLTDLNPGTALVRADDLSLVASGSLQIDQSNNVGTMVSDLYPDNHGPASLSEAFLVVNDTLYLVAGPNGASSGGSINYITARIKARVVKLSTKDWMAIAIQSTAADN